MGIRDIRKNSNSGDFLSLKDGQKVKLRIVGEEPHANYSIFSNDVNAGANLPEGYELPEPLMARLQHVFTVYNLESNTIQILKTSQATAEKFLAAYEAYHDSWDFDFVFSRKGSGLDTEYTAVVIPTEFKTELLADKKLPDLDKVFAISDEADVARVLPGALKNAIAEKEKRDAAKAAKKAAKDATAAGKSAPAKVADKPKAAAAPEKPAPAPAAQTEASLDSMVEDPPAKPKFTHKRVIVDLRTAEEKACPACKAKGHTVERVIKEGNMKTVDPETNLPWGRCKAAICNTCKGLTILEKVEELPAVAA